MSPQLTALGAISEADGVTEVLESTAALQNAEAALQSRFDSYHAAAALAEVADARGGGGARRRPGCHREGARGPRRRARRGLRGGPRGRLASRASATG